MQREPLLTALVSVYRAHRFLAGCLDDLLDQTIAHDIEIVVIDSGSPEQERELVAEYQIRYPNIRYIRTEKRETLYSAWNRGIESASGRYLTSANADDRHHPAFAETMIHVLESHPSQALAWADSWVTVDENKRYGHADVIGRFRWPEFDRLKLFRVPYIGPQPVWRRSLIDRYGLFDASMVSAGDYEYWLRLSVSESFFHVNEPLGLYHYAPRGLEHSNIRDSRRESEIARERYWKASWGKRPRPKGSYLYWTPSFWLRELLRGRLLPPPRLV